MKYLLILCVTILLSCEEKTKPEPKPASTLIVDTAKNYVEYHGGDTTIERKGIKITTSGGGENTIIVSQVK